MVYLFVASFVHGKRSLDVAEDSVVSDAHHRLAAHSTLPGVAVDHSCGVAGQDDLVQDFTEPSAKQAERFPTSQSPVLSHALGS